MTSAVCAMDVENVCFCGICYPINSISHPAYYSAAIPAHGSREVMLIEAIVHQVLFWHGRLHFCNIQCSLVLLGPTLFINAASATVSRNNYAI